MEIEAQETPACLRGSDVACVNIVLDLVYLEFLGRDARGETKNCLLFSGGWLGALLMAKDMHELAGPGPLAHTHRLTVAAPAKRFVALRFHCPLPASGESARARS